ncbi:MAG: cyclodeaminase/cyclohydrolase family protein [Planctomycetes bacterium]|nr:cyclodeaminase/cyclohydrolase family protein [Planctomycetota bacterium]
MIDQPFGAIVASLASKTPTPGGGAAAAMAGSMGAALFVMVVRFSRGKKANLDRDAELAAAETRLDALVQELLPMAERDCRSFDAVSAAYALPKDTDAQKAAREAAVQQGMLGAMEVPELTLGLVRAVFTAIEPVVGCVGKAIASDLASGAALLAAAAEGAFLNVKINAAYLTDRPRAEAALGRATAVRDQVRAAQAKITAAVDRLLA